MTEPTRPHPTLDRIADLLEMLRGALAARSGDAPPATRPNAGAPGVFVEAMKLLSAQERILRQQSTIAERVLERLRGERGDLVQRVVPLRASAGGVAGGRFLVANDASKPGRFTFRPGFELPVSFRPAELSLEAGEEKALDVRIDLSGSPFRAGETAVLPLDVCVDDIPRVRVWLDVALDAEEARS